MINYEYNINHTRCSQREQYNKLFSYSHIHARISGFSFLFSENKWNVKDLCCTHTLKGLSIRPLLLRFSTIRHINYEILYLCTTDKIHKKYSNFCLSAYELSLKTDNIFLAQKTIARWCNCVTVTYCHLFSIRLYVTFPQADEWFFLKSTNLNKWKIYAKLIVKYHLENEKLYFRFDFQAGAVLLHALMSFCFCSCFQINWIKTKLKSFI